MRLGASAALASNTGWSIAANPAEISATAARIGDFHLAPGAYTAQVTGVGGTNGVALIEVYEVP